MFFAIFRVQLFLFFRLIMCFSMPYEISYLLFNMRKSNAFMALQKELIAPFLLLLLVLLRSVLAILRPLFLSILLLIEIKMLVVALATTSGVGGGG